MTLYVTPLGNDETGTGSIEKPFRTPQAAFLYAVNGEEIRIAPGTYGKPTLLQRLVRACAAWRSR